MDIVLSPRPLRGDVTIIPSKSQAHRLLICSAFSDKSTHLICPETSRDIEATAVCLRAIGTEILRTETGYTVFPIRQLPQNATMDCKDSGSTLRFLLPIAGALGIDTTFILSGRLPQRPLSPLWEEMERMGCSLSRPAANTIRCQGKLRPGEYRIAGNVSSQFITGLLFALSLIPGESHLEILGRIESKPYIALTRQALSLFQAPRYHSPGLVSVEGDWSNGAFFVTAQFLGNELTIHNLDEASTQGDREIVSLLRRLCQENQTISVSDIPDLVPILAVFAAFRHGAVLTDISRLRLKESDRVETTLSMINNLGGMACVQEDTLTIAPQKLIGGTVDSVNDHRIAMAAAVAATVCRESVTILGADCVQKSYPKFWDEYVRLGGKYEQLLR